MTKRKKTVNELLEEALFVEDEQPFQVPENWVWVTLKDVCKINMGQSPKGEYTTDDSNNIPLIGGPADMGATYPNAKRYTIKPTKLSENGELIVSVRATLGKTNITDGQYCLGRGVAGIKSNIIDIRLLRYYFETIKSHLYSISTGTTFQQISRKNIESIAFPLLPLNEQKRIADKVERLLSKIEEAKQLIEEAKETFELRRAAILDKAFRGELTRKWRGENHKESSDTEVVQTDKTLYNLPFNWEWVDLDTVCEKITDGTHHSPKSYPSGDYMYITAKNIKKQGILLDNVTYVSKEVHQEIYNRCDVKKGDVLYIKDGATTGIATVNQITEEFSLLSSVALLRSKRNVLAAKYLMYCLNSPSTKSRMLGMISGNAITRLTLKKIKQGIIPLPPFDEQEIIVSILEKVNSVDEQLDYVTNLEDNINNLKQSILSKAFRGELGTNDPSEESAIELLKEVLQDQVK
ncbi:restriction endonuclease subunit S [Bacillus sp. GBSW2]|uniref:restriction endonuclease subunit S n=1 Tax=Bacillus sp. GBSW2 TaxID=2108541 RepID=UPI000D032FE8|nr:restriction endonuclease subunit S [Bacillus sp. GBSW2]PRS75942.1 restriction endonuclease subunit S [Bacillus sp. GBSW2]